MHDFPFIEQLRLIGASPDALHAVWALVALWGVVVLALLIAWGILSTSCDLLWAKIDLRDRALDRLRGGRA